MSSIVPLLGDRYSAQAKRPRLSDRQDAVRQRILREDTPGDWEHSSCPCGVAGEDIVISEVDRHGLPYRKCLCRNCGLLRVDPRWTEARLSRFYTEEYRDLYSTRGNRRATEYAQWVASEPSARGIARFVESAVQRWLKAPHTENPTVVEVGAGGGWNLSHLPSRWRRIGYDGDVEFLDAGARAFGIETRLGFLSEAMPALGGADVVLLSHVVEHLSDPMAALQQVANAVAPHCLILVEVPGVFRIHRTVRDPMRYMQNAHLFTFCASTLQLVCALAGVRVRYADEWCRLVASPGQDHRRAELDRDLAERVRRYLQRCERTWTAAVKLKKMPLAGSAAARLYSLLMDRIMRVRLGESVVGSSEFR